MTLQLTENLWKLKLDTVFDAQVNQFYLGSFSNPFVIVNINSDYTSPVWRQAGNIGQAITFQDSLAYGELKEVFLDSFLLLQFPLLSGEEYNLYYFPLPRLVQAKFKIWEYQGETVDTSVSQLFEILSAATFPKLENDIKKINQYLSSLSNQNYNQKKATKKDENLLFNFLM